MRKGRRGSTLARRPVGLLSARGFHFRHAQGPPDANRALRGTIIVTTCNLDKNNNTFWHSLLVVSGNRGVIAVDSLFRLGCAPPQAGIARRQRTKSTKRTDRREHTKRARRVPTRVNRHARANG